MKSRAIKSLVLSVFSLFYVEANALVLSPLDCGPTNCVTDAGVGSSSNPNAADIAAFMQTTSLEMLYKADVGDVDSPETVYDGLFADSYTTKFTNSEFDPSDALIEYIDGSDFIDICGGPGDECYLSVKDGKNDPSLYIFDISGLWNGTDDILLTEFWPAQGAISNVAIWGGDNGTSVSEPGTIALFGLGLLSLALSRRKLS